VVFFACYQSSPFGAVEMLRITTDNFSGREVKLVVWVVKMKNVQVIFQMTKKYTKLKRNWEFYVNPVFDKIVFFI